MLLQAIGYRLFRDIENETVILFILGILGLVLIMILLLYLRKKAKNSVLNDTKRRDVKERHFSMMALHKITSNLGLDKEQKKMLSFVFLNDNVSDPERSLNSPNLWDRHFKKAFRIIERTTASESELNEKLTVLFSIRNLIEEKSGVVSTTSTRQIPENSAAILGIEEDSYPVRIISTKGDSMIIENPVNSEGELIQVPKGSKASLSFFTKSNKAFSVDSRVLGVMETAEGTVLQLVHSGMIKKLSHRRFRRRQSVQSAAFHFVSYEAKEGKSQKLIVDNNRYNGNIMDISIGGCSIRTGADVNAGQLMKIEFARDEKHAVAALGEVLRVNKMGINTIVYVKFIKVPARSLNLINAMVYEYSDK